MDSHKFNKLSNKYIRFFNLDIKFTAKYWLILYERYLLVLKSRIHSENPLFWSKFHSVRKSLWIIENVGGIINEKLPILFSDFNTDQLQNIRKQLIESIEAMRDFIKMNYINIVKINEFPYMRSGIRDFLEWIFPEVVKEVSNDILSTLSSYNPRRFAKVDIDISRSGNINKVSHWNDLSWDYYDQDWEYSLWKLNFTDKGIFPSQISLITPNILRRNIYTNKISKSLIT